MTWLLGIGKWVAGVLVGGGLTDILSTINKSMDADVERERLKAEVTKTWINKKVELLVGRTWWFQLFFVIPAGMYWTALIWVSAFPMLGWEVKRLPGFAEDVWLYIVSGLFIVDGGKALVARFKK